MNETEAYQGEFFEEYKDRAGLFLCLSGTASIMVNGQVYNLERGGLYIVSPLIVLCKVSQSADFSGIHILDELKVFYSAIHSLIDTILQLKLRNSPCLRLSESEIEFVKERSDLIEAKKAELNESQIAAEKTLIQNTIHLLEQATLLEVIRIYFRERLIDPEPLDKKETIVYNFIYSLHQNFKEKRSVTFYANEAGLSVGYFTSVVRAKTGRTPLDWIIQVTIAQAKLLLERSKKSVKEVASELNFPEQFTFRKYFKQYVGMPPKEYRKQFSNSEKPE